MSSEYSRIFAALDGSQAQITVAHRALAFARDNGAALRFGHVVDAVPAEASAANFQELCAATKEVIEESLRDIIAEAEACPSIPSVELIVEAGSIDDVLIHEMIEPFDPDLVICGARGLSNIKYAFVGSVSTNLIRSMKCDVLVVK